MQKPSFLVEHGRLGAAAGAGYFRHAVKPWLARLLDMAKTGGKRVLAALRRKPLPAYAKHVTDAEAFASMAPAVASLGKWASAAGRGGVPSMAQGGMVSAPARTGKLAVVHNGELVVPKRKVRKLLDLARGRMSLPTQRR